MPVVYKLAVAQGGQVLSHVELFCVHGYAMPLALKTCMNSSATPATYTAAMKAQRGLGGCSSTL